MTHVSIKFVTFNTSELIAAGTAIEISSLSVAFLLRARGELTSISRVMPSFLNLCLAFVYIAPKNVPKVTPLIAAAAA